MVMNTSDFAEEPQLRTCVMNKVVWSNSYDTEKTSFAIIAIILNGLSMPVIILMNALVVAAVKTTPRLRTNYNFLLACLAGTDLLVGIVVQPSFIAVQINVLRGISLEQFCQHEKEFSYFAIIPILSSFYHLTLISVERFVAIKHPYRYTTVCTNRCLITAVAISWVMTSFRVCFSMFNFFVIIFCHISVYFVSRRHECRIRSEQVSLQAAADFAKEKKALKTTRIIILTLLLCILPPSVYGLFLRIFSNSSNYIVTVVHLSHPVGCFKLIFDHSTEGKRFNALPISERNSSLNKPQTYRRGRGSSCAFVYAVLVKTSLRLQTNYNVVLVC
ncbi:unnamed protein product [Pocillopora meandrina]|uniref:G-protein coupled receptors family 1 profile domain-containing protein n=1 Tax=Pocillopora meandrina TaxID=46732 RepID=A0AAU9X785_9CNID|nr:unnamed protein product [Pocillopora meandrina]